MRPAGAGAAPTPAPALSPLTQVGGDGGVVIAAARVYGGAHPARKKEPPLSADEPAVDEALAIAHGLKPDEYARFVALIGRTPTFTELGIVSAMWNEHCSYKSSRLHLRELPTKAPWVIQGPGENAGVIDIGDGDACVFKMESHNHPSYHRALSGRGDRGRRHPARRVHHGRAARRLPQLPALRRARASQDARIWSPASSRASAATAIRSACRRSAARSASTRATTATSSSTRWRSASRAPTRSSTPRRPGVGNPIVYLGSKTGRDGIHGATMASAAFEADAEEKRPTVQVGDPFAEKLLLEACLELMASGAVVAIQDMGAAGLTSSAVEMGAKGDLGVELDLDRVPCRETGMTRLRDDAVGEPGAHADGAPAREGAGGRGDLPQMGARLRRHRQDDRHEALRRQAAAARSRPTCRSRSSATRRRSTTGRGSRRRAVAGSRRRRRSPPPIPTATRC